MSDVAIGFAGFGVLLLLLAIRVPIAFALASVSVVGIGVLTNFHVSLSVLAEQPYKFIASWNLSAIPMFILMGCIAYRTGMTRSLFRAGRVWLSALPGGLAVASTVACGMFAAASGSSVATAAAMGRIAIPEMSRYRYDPGLAAGSVAAAGTLGSLIPPSILMILYAIFAQVSVSKALIAGILPGVLSCFMYALMIGIRCKISPKLAPPVENKVTWRERLEVLAEIWPLPVLVLGVIGGMYAGVFTATEAGAAGSLLAVLIAVVQRRVSWRVIKEIIKDATEGSTSILFIALGGLLLSKFMALSGLPDYAAQYITELSVNPLFFVIVVSGIYIFLGMFLDSIGIMLLTLPILIPILDAEQISLLWFGVLVIKYLEIGLITPPVGLNVFVIKSVVGDSIRLETIFKGILWFLLTDIITLTILISFPQVSLFLPNFMN